MDEHTRVLWELAEELFSSIELQSLHTLAKTTPLNVAQLAEFDLKLDGPSMSRINYNNEGRYQAADRDVFRPLQYCAAYFNSEGQPTGTEWLTRHIVHMSSLHIESLIKRISGFRYLPLGDALRKAIVKRRIEPLIWSQIDRFTRIYNDVKHNVSHPKDTHMFSMEDAILAYVVCRKLGAALYSLADLATDLNIFKQEYKDEHSTP